MFFADFVTNQSQTFAGASVRANVQGQKREVRSEERTSETHLLRSFDSWLKNLGLAEASAHDQSGSERGSTKNGHQEYR
jgi:hypothetical protein